MSEKTEPKPRATVARVDHKIDQILEEMDGIRIEMSQIRSALKELASILSPPEDKKADLDPSTDFGMFG